MDDLRSYCETLHEKQAIEFEIAALRQLIADIAQPEVAALTEAA